MKHKSIQIKLFTFLIMTTFFSSAGIAGDLNINDTDDSVRFVRFVHAAPYAGVVDVWNEKGIITSNFAYGLVSPYIKSADGENEIIYLAVNKTDEIVAEFPIGKYKGGTQYTIIIHNIFDDDSGKYDISAIISEDPEVTTESAGTFIGAAHTAADVGSVQFTTDKGLGDAWVKLIQGGFSGFVNLPTPNKILIDVNSDRMADVTFSIPALPYSDFVYGMVVSDKSGVYLFALLSDNTLVKIQPDTIDPEPMMSYVRIIHLAQEFGAVDVFLDGNSKAVSGLDYGESIGYIALQTGEYVVDIVKFGSPIIDSLKNVTLSLDPLTSYTVVAYQTSKGLELLVTEDYRTQDMITLKAKIRATHLIEQVGKVDVYVLINNSADKAGNQALLINDLGFQLTQGYLAVPAQKYRIGLDVDQSGSIDLTYDLPQLLHGDVVDLYAVLNEKGLPVIYTLVESGDLFISEAIELTSTVDDFGGNEKSSKSGQIIFQGKPDVIIDPPSGGFQPIEIMM